MITRQRVFDYVKRHLLQQMYHSRSSKGLCAYRGIYGAKCAIGCLIPDSRYTPALEGLGCPSTEIQRAVFGRPARVDARPEERSPMLELLCDLQRVHDAWLPNRWRKELDKVAEMHGLTP